MQTQITGFGPNSSEPAQVDPTTGALRVSLRPIDYTPSFGGVIGGHYKIGTMTGTMAAGIASLAQVFQVRWADPSKLFLLQRMLVQCARGPASRPRRSAVRSSSSSGHGSTANGSGGTALAPNSISNRMRGIDGSVRVCHLWRDPHRHHGRAHGGHRPHRSSRSRIGICQGAPNATLAQSPQMILFESSAAGDHPLVLNSGDTLAIRTSPRPRPVPGQWP